MKITRRDNNMVDFVDLSVGAIFIDENNNVAMKIEEIYTYTDAMGTLNAIYLDNGTLGCYGYKEKVKELDAELVVG